MSKRTGWAISAAILIQRGGWSIHISHLADLVQKTGLAGLGIKGKTPDKTLRNQLDKNNPHPDWFEVADNHVSLSEDGHRFAPLDREVVEVLRDISSQQNINEIPPLPEEVTSEKFIEGAPTRVSINRYERDQKARQKCIEHHKAKCVVCGIDFGLLYGPVAEGFIHVHHLKPLWEIRKGYEVDPVVDLKPVCPNCHAIIRLGGIVRTINEVQAMLQYSVGLREPSV